MSTPKAALFASFLGRYSTIMVYAASNVVLSRLLTPHDTGLFTVGFALTVMIGTLRDFGVGTYVIQERDLTDLKWRSALGISVVTSFAVFAAVVAASFVAGRAYHDAAVTRVMLISGLTLLLIPFNSVVMTWLRREMRYGTLAWIGLAGAAAQSVITIGLAWADQGAMSMAWGSVANSSVTLIGSIACRPRHFSHWPTLAGWRPIAGFGVYSTVALICNEITPNGADLFIGAFRGLASVGEFSKGVGLVGFVNQGLTSAILPVALSLFAAKRRAGETLALALPQGLVLLTGITWPAFAGLSLVAAPTIRLLFGPQWDRAAAPAHVVVLAAMLTSMTALHATIFAATGAMRARMLVQLAVTPAQLAVLFLAAHGTLVEAAFGTVASAAIEFVPSQIMVNRICGTRMRLIIGALVPSGVVTICTIIGPAIIAVLMPSRQYSLLLSLGAMLASGAVGWFAGLMISAHPLGKEIVSVLRSARAFLGRRGPAGSPKPP